MTCEEFIKRVADVVLKVMDDYDIKVASPIIAQACLESGYGGSSLSREYNNHFGLKCGSGWTGRSVNMATQEEYDEGVLTNIVDNFRVYDNFEDGVIGYFEFIQYDRYSNLKGVYDYREYCELIKEDGYATSSTYVDSLIELIKMWDLVQYDYVSNSDNIGYDDITEMALDVIDGKYGNGMDRVMKLGDLYDKVQARVNEIMYGDCEELIKEADIQELAERVIRGEFGNGEDRRRALGKYYDRVQEKVNDIMFS